MFLKALLCTFLFCDLQDIRSGFCRQEVQFQYGFYLWKIDKEIVIEKNQAAGQLFLFKVTSSVSLEVGIEILHLSNP